MLSSAQSKGSILLRPDLGRCEDFFRQEALESGGRKAWHWGWLWYECQGSMPSSNQRVLVEIGKDERWTVKHSTPHSRHAYTLLRAHYLADLQCLRAEQPLLEEESPSRFRKMHLPEHLLIKLHIYG